MLVNMTHGPFGELEAVTFELLGVVVKPPMPAPVPREFLAYTFAKLEEDRVRVGVVSFLGPRLTREFLDAAYVPRELVPESAIIDCPRGPAAVEVLTGFLVEHGVRPTQSAYIGTSSDSRRIAERAGMTYMETSSATILSRSLFSLAREAAGLIPKPIGVV